MISINHHFAKNYSHFQKGKSISLTKIDVKREPELLNKPSSEHILNFSFDGLVRTFGGWINEFIGSPIFCTR